MDTVEIIVEATEAPGTVECTMAGVVGAGMGAAEAVTLVLGSTRQANSTRITAEEAAMAVTRAVVAVDTGATTGAGVAIGSTGGGMMITTAGVDALTGAGIVGTTCGSTIGVATVIDTGFGVGMVVGALAEGAVDTATGGSNEFSRSLV